MPSAVTPPDFNVLIRRSLALRQLYRGAIQNSEPGLGVVLGDNAQTLGLLIADLQQHVRLAGIQPHRHCGWSTWTCNRLIIRFLILSRAGGAVWLRLLAHREAGLQQQFERALVGLEPPAARVLRRQLSRLHALALDMHSLVGPHGR